VKGSGVASLSAPHQSGKLFRGGVTALAIGGNAAALGDSSARHFFQDFFEIVLAAGEEAAIMPNVPLYDEIR
jgi:hypothetical protein